MTTWFASLRKKAAMMIYKIEQLQLSSKVVGDDCWQEKNSKGFKKRLRNSRTNHLEERGNDTIQARSSSDFDVKCYVKIRI
jgi:hypothetical protein